MILHLAEIMNNPGCQHPWHNSPERVKVYSLFEWPPSESLIKSLQSARDEYFKNWKPTLDVDPPQTIIDAENNIWKLYHPQTSGMFFTCYFCDRNLFGPMYSRGNMQTGLYHAHMECLLRVERK